SAAALCAAVARPTLTSTRACAPCASASAPTSAGASATAKRVFFTAPSFSGERTAAFHMRRARGGLIEDVDPLYGPFSLLKADRHAARAPAQARAVQQRGTD